MFEFILIRVSCASIINNFYPTKRNFLDNHRQKVSFREGKVKVDTSFGSKPYRTFPDIHIILFQPFLSFNLNALKDSRYNDKFLNLLGLYHITFVWHLYLCIFIICYTFNYQSPEINLFISLFIILCKQCSQGISWNGKRGIRRKMEKSIQSKYHETHWLMYPFSFLYFSSRLSR